MTSVQGSTEPNADAETPDLSAAAREIAQLRAERDAARAEAARASAEAHQLGAALDLLPVGVVIADREGRIVHGNAELERMVGHRVLLSASADHYAEWNGYHADGRRVATEEYPLYAVLREGAESAGLDVHYERPGGERVWIHLTARAIVGSGGEPEGALVAAVEIDAIKQGEAEKELLLAELDHRVKNVFTTMIALIGRSLRGSDALERAAESLRARIHAYAESHAALTQTDWTSSSIGDVAQVILGGHIASGRIVVEGPPTLLRAKAALSLSMAFHELATNATKYGALSVEEGHVELRWSSSTPDADHVTIEWREIGGPPVSQPSRQGFGSFITRQAVALETGGEVSLVYAPDGLRWTLERVPT